ncbi:MAG: TetR family transcriptional regulator [Halioglobus sp.]
MRRTKEDAAKTRQRVIDAALKLFGQRGYSGTTLRLIADEAGCSRGPIYWHFANKEELFEAILAYSQVPLERLVEMYRLAQDPIDPEAVAGEFARRWLRLLLEDRYFRQSFEIFLNKTEFTEAVSKTLKRERALTASLISTFTELVERSRLLRGVQPAQPAQTVALSMYAYLMGITQSWLFYPQVANLEDSLEYFVADFLRLLRAGE